MNSFHECNSVYFILFIIHSLSNKMASPSKTADEGNSTAVLLNTSDDELTESQVQTLLELNAFVARFATGNRDLGRSLNVLMKIYSRTAENEREVKGFYRCSWCRLIFKFMPKKGTQPMLRHICSCEHRPEGYALPLVNEHLHNRNPSVVPNTHETKSNAPANTASGTVDIDANINAAERTTQPGLIGHKLNNIPKASLAKILAVANSIGARYGRVNENEFSEILNSTVE